MKFITKGTIHVLMIVVLLLSFHHLGYASHGPDDLESIREWQRLNEFAEEALFLLNKNEFEATKKTLNDLSAHFLTLDTAKYLGQVEQVHVILSTIVEAKETLNKVEFDIKQAESKLLRMRLALDAVSHHQQPLWINYYPSFVKTMDDLQYSLEHNNRDLFYHSINLLEKHFEMVRPSMYVSHPGSVVEKLHSQLVYLTTNKEELWREKDRAVDMLSSLEHDVNIAFLKKKEESLQSITLLIFGISTLILSVLSYVAWRKYRGERERRPITWKKFMD